METPLDKELESVDNRTLFILGRLEGKVDSLLVAQAHLNDAVGALEGRVRNLETYRAHLLGAASAISAAVSAGFWYLANLFHK